MSIWSRWFKSKDKPVSVVQSATETVAHKGTGLAAPVSVAPVAMEFVKESRECVLPIEWPGTEDAVVAQNWMRMWQQSREKAEQWLLDQQQRDAKKLELWSSGVITLAATNDMRQRLLDVIADVEILKSLLVVFKQKDKSIYKRLRNFLAPDVAVKSSQFEMPSDVQSVQVCAWVAPEKPPQSVVEADTTDYAGCSQLCQQTLNLYQALSELSPHHLSPLKTLLDQQQHAQEKALQSTEPSPEQLRFLQDYQRLQQLTAAVMRWLACVDELQRLCQAKTFSKTTSATLLQKKIARLQTLLDELNWPLAGDSLLLLRQAKQQLKQLPVQLVDLQQQFEQTQNTWQAQLPLLEQYLQAGDLLKAESALKVLQRLALNPKKTQQLQGLSQRLIELKDWQGFAELPKKQQLIEAIQQLVDKPLPVEQQSQRIKNLQAQWQMLNVSEHHALWQQFKNLADIAYLPCQQFYAAQKQQRLENAKTREILCAQLEQYIAEHDWAKADWAKVRQTQQVAKQSWRAAFPIERHLSSALQKRFDAVMQQLQARQDDFQRLQVQRRQQRQQLIEEKAAKRQQQLALAAQQKQQEQERQAKQQAQQLAQQQQRQQLEQSYLLRLQQHVDGGVSTLEDEQKKNEDEQQKRSLVIRLEILAGLPSPDDEQALRMQVQVERLAKNFQAAGSKLAPHHECVERWCEGLRMSAAHHDLLARMQLAYQQYSVQHYASEHHSSKQ